MRTQLSYSSGGPVSAEQVSGSNHFNDGTSYKELNGISFEEYDNLGRIMR
jgi:hypothetical protein